MTFQMGARPTGLIRGSRRGRTGSEGESERGSRIREVELTQGGLELADADVVVKPWLPSVARGGGCFKR